MGQSVSLLELPLGHSLFRAALRLGLSLETAGPDCKDTAFLECLGYTTC